MPPAASTPRSCTLSFILSKDSENRNRLLTCSTTSFGETTFTALSSTPPGCSTWQVRSEEHTSELQSQSNLVCRLLLEKKKKQHIKAHHTPLQMSAVRETPLG